SCVRSSIRGAMVAGCGGGYSCVQVGQCGTAGGVGHWICTCGRRFVRGQSLWNAGRLPFEVRCRGWGFGRLCIGWRRGCGCGGRGWRVDGGWGWGGGGGVGAFCEGVGGEVGVGGGGGE